jgi:5-formyltetrahydrofolate cyclo-ligase
LTLHQPTKSALRQSFLERRLQMLPNDRALASQAVLEAFFGHVQAAEGAVVAGYWPVKGEVDCLPILHALLRKGHPCALPHVTGEGAPLIFRRWDEKSRMVAGKYEITEPAEGEVLAPDIVLVPLLAFDAECHRLGYGAGFYDRTIARLRKQKPVKAVGLAYEMQFYGGGLPANGHDVRMDMIVTDRNVYQ